MGLTLSQVYLDTCLVIYFVENHARFGPIVTAALEQATGVQFAISP